MGWFHGDGYTNTHWNTWNPSLSPSCLVIIFVYIISNVTYISEWWLISNEFDGLSRFRESFTTVILSNPDMQGGSDFCLFAAQVAFPLPAWCLCVCVSACVSAPSSVTGTSSSPPTQVCRHWGLSEQTQRCHVYLYWRQQRRTVMSPGQVYQSWPADCSQEADIIDII